MTSTTDDGFALFVVTRGVEIDQERIEKSICGVLKGNAIVIGHVADGFVVIPDKD
jgi:hypothetical protein